MEKQKIKKMLKEIELKIHQIREELNINEFKTNKIPEKRKKEGLKTHGLDFSMAKRAFIKKYCKDKSGENVFTIIIAYLSKGDKKKIEYEEIRKTWKSCEGLIDSSWHSNYGSRAKEKDLVFSPENGTYQLRPNWINAFNLENE